MKKLPHDAREMVLTPEFINKSDKDIKTIQGLNSIADKKGVIFVLSGGYATEAHCGGEITRPHGDIDARFVVKGDSVIGNIFSAVENLLSSENTTWEKKKETETRLEFLEKDKSKFFEKRRLELKMYTSSNYKVDIERGVLTNSSRQKININIVGYNDLVVGKIHKFCSLKAGIDTTKDRHSSVSDYLDLKRLLDLPSLNEELLISKLTKMPELTSETNPKLKAEEEFKYVKELLVSYFRYKP